MRPGNILDLLRLAAALQAFVFIQGQRSSPYRNLKRASISPAAKRPRQGVRLFLWPRSANRKTPLIQQPHRPLTAADASTLSPLPSATLKTSPFEPSASSKKSTSSPAKTRATHK